MSVWFRESWRARPSAYIPDYPDPRRLRLAEETLRSYPPLVFAGEVRRLKSELARAARGEAFLLQGGDCAETFADFNSLGIRDTFRVMLQMALVLTFVCEKPVVRVGRVAGQFAKPRSRATETADGETILTYRGDMINANDPTPAARTPDPDRMLRAYFQSTATLNLLRAFTDGGYGDLYTAGRWLLDSVGGSAVRERYESLAATIHKSLAVMRAYSRPGAEEIRLAEKIDYYCSHEALFLPYEEALARRDHLTGDALAASAHFLWLGDRTRDPESPQAEFLRGVINPLGVKCGPDTDAGDLERLLDRIDPDNEPGRVTLILRMGAARAADSQARLIRSLRRAGRSALWVVDPMHGNPKNAAGGVATRLFPDIMEECRIFIAVCRAEGAHPGGLHLEMTGKNVTECLGGADAVAELAPKYGSLCDPRLNASQSLELAFAFAEQFRDTAKRP